MIKRPIFLAALIVALAFYLLTFFRPDFFIPSAAAEYSDNVTVTGRVWKIHDKGTKQDIYLTGALINGSACGCVLIQYSDISESSKIKTGNKVKITGELKDFNIARNFGNYDEKEYYRSLGIFYRIIPDETFITDNRINLAGHLMLMLKRRLIFAFESIAGKGSGILGTGSISGIFSAIVTGERSRISDTAENLYRQGGIIHILAVSGLHISIIGMGLYRMLRKFISFIPAALISSLCMVLYCVMCGAGVSVIRATGMFMIHLCAFGLGKTFDMLNAASIIAIILLFSNPFYITNSGFQMSFMAVMSIAICADAFTKYIGTSFRLLKSVVSALAVSICMIPLIAGTYYEVPVYSFALNIIVIPLMQYILVSALSGGLAGIISMAIGRFLLGTGAILLRFSESLCILCSELPANIIVTGRVSAYKIVSFYIIIAFAVLMIKKAFKRNEKTKSFRLIIIASACVMSLVILFARAPLNGLRMLFFDVGQGECIVIKSPSGKVYMIDGGSSDIDHLTKYRLASALKYERISKIDYSIITHPDTDHISGILEIISNSAYGIDIEKVLIPYVPKNEKYSLLESECTNKNIDLINVYSGMSMDDADVHISFLYPDEGFLSEDTNEYSLVTSLSYGDFDALFTGDLPAYKDEKIVIEKEYELLKIAHHGSKNSSSEKFLNEVSPEIAIISAGVNNSYGHPHDETIKRIESVGADIYCTKEYGEIIVDVSKQGNINIKTKIG